MSQKTPIAVAYGDSIGPEIITHEGLQLKMIDNRGTIVRTETLRTIDGQQGFSVAQGR
jgi:hypothetical protein